MKTKDIASKLGVSQRQIYRWRNEEEYIRRNNALIAESLRFAQRQVRDWEQQDLPSKRDILDWLKFIASQSEKLDLTISHAGMPQEQISMYLTSATVKSLFRHSKGKK